MRRQRTPFAALAVALAMTPVVAQAAVYAMSFADMLAARQDFYDLGPSPVDTVGGEAPGEAYAMGSARHADMWGPPTRPAMVVIDAPGYSAGEKIVEIGGVDCVHKTFTPQMRLFDTAGGEPANGDTPLPAEGMTTWLSPAAATAAVKVFCPGFSAPKPALTNATLGELPAK